MPPLIKSATFVYAYTHPWFKNFMKMLTLK